MHGNTLTVDTLSVTVPSYTPLAAQGGSIKVLIMPLQPHMISRLPSVAILSQAIQNNGAEAPPFLQSMGVVV